MPQAGGNAGEQLRNFIERWERIQEEIDGLKEDQKEIMSGAKAVGFNPKIIKMVIKRRKLSEAERQELDALLDIYCHAVGMDDTPLGDAARRHLSGKPPKGDDDDADGNDDADAEEEGPITPAITEKELATARKEGAKAAKDGVEVLKNPYMADDPRRAAWDEGWCGAIGSDGMDIPAAFGRRGDKKADPKKPDGESK